MAMCPPQGVTSAGSTGSAASAGTLDVVSVPLLRRAALTAAVLAVPVGWVTRAAWGLPDRPRRAPPPAAPARRRLPALLRRQVPQHARDPRAGPGQHPRRPAAAVARGAARRLPGGPIPLAHAELPAEAAELAVTWFGHASALLEVDGAAGAGRPGVGLPRLAVAGVRPDPAARAADAARGAAAGRRRPHLARPLRPPGPADGARAAGARRRRRSSSRSASASTCASGTCPTTGSSSWTGTASTTVGGLTLTCTEARHFSGRYFYRDTTLWASWAITGPRHRVFFGGDTGYHPAFAGIGARLGPFDLTLLPVGAYNDAWHSIHMDPEEAVRAHGDLGGRVLLPIHWATFNLAFHRWAEPVQRLLAAADGQGHRRSSSRARRADRRARPAAARPTGGRRSARPRRTPTACTRRARAARCWCGPRPGCSGSATDGPPRRLT